MNSHVAPAGTRAIRVPHKLALQRCYNLWHRLRISFLQLEEILSTWYIRSESLIISFPVMICLKALHIRGKYHPLQRRGPALPSLWSNISHSAVLASIGGIFYPVLTHLSSKPSTRRSLTSSSSIFSKSSSSFAAQNVNKFNTRKQQCILLGPISLSNILHDRDLCSILPRLHLCATALHRCFLCVAISLLDFFYPFRSVGHPSMMLVYQNALSSLHGSWIRSFIVKIQAVFIGRLGSKTQMPFENTSFQIDRGCLELAAEIIKQGKR